MFATRSAARSRRALRTGAVVAVSVLVLLPGTAHAAVPAAPVRLPAAIEGFATYQKQTTCSPTAKPGTVKLRNLLLKTYPGTRNLGIVRACSAGGTSEHKEGRALDWGVRVSSATERAKASAFLSWLLKYDAAGHQAANARRLGVMYVIWNKKIWGAYSAGSGWRTYSGSNPHTDHVHISLSRSGGAGTTSFWTGKVNSAATTPTTSSGWNPPATASNSGYPRPPVPGVLPAPRPGSTVPAGPPLQDETLAVPATRAGAWTRAALVKGQSYRVEVRGTWRWNKATGTLADAECSTTPGSDWQRTRALVADVSGDQLGLYLDGHDLALSSYQSRGCATETHTYATTVVAARSGRVPLAVWEPAKASGWADNSSTLRVRIIHDVARDVLSLNVATRDPAGTTTPGSVVAGQAYTLTATGTWVPATGAIADAVCVDDGTGFRRRAREAVSHLYDLVVSGYELSADCTADHRYTWTFTAPRSGPLVLSVKDTSYGDNSGFLAVRLTRATASSPDAATIGFDGSGDGSGDWRHR